MAEIAAKAGILLPVSILNGYTYFLILLEYSNSILGKR